MLEAVKLSLRITNNAFNSEIEDLIEAARLDLIQSGVSSSVAKPTEGTEDDPLIKRAIKLYCKANFGFDNPDADRLNHSYNLLKTHLSLASDYNGANDAI